MSGIDEVSIDPKSFEYLQMKKSSVNKQGLCKGRNVNNRMSSAVNPQNKNLSFSSKGRI